MASWAIKCCIKDSGCSFRIRISLIWMCSLTRSQALWYA
jgi:hypothetical protein